MVPKHGARAAIGTSKPPARLRGGFTLAVPPRAAGYPTFLPPTGGGGGFNVSYPISLWAERPPADGMERPAVSLVLMDLKK